MRTEKHIAEGVYPVPLRYRSRANRALRWPLIAWRYKQAGVSWRTALLLTHWAIWYPHSNLQGSV